MAPRILGLHHVTATVDDAQADLDFCIELLGLRLVKKTVNFDNHNVYHFYYGNELGDAGHDLDDVSLQGLRRARRREGRRAGRHDVFLGADGFARVLAPSACARRASSRRRSRSALRRAGDRASTIRAGCGSS